MATDDKPPVAVNEAPKDIEEEAPLTKEEFAAQMQRLTERARAAGLQPLETMARTYARQGILILESLLDALEKAVDTKKKKA